MVYVLGLVQSVGVEENDCVGVNLSLLPGEFPVGHYTYRQVGVNRQHSGAGVTYKQRCVMAGVAVLHTSGNKVQHTHKHGHEHIGLVLL